MTIVTGIELGGVVGMTRDEAKIKQKRAKRKRESPLEADRKLGAMGEGVRVEGL